ncbi:hypothetical protein GCM10010106_16870 [Thermopolyspora flexuosa]|nr:hypothetical protein GCM10010106_16870 [Thermopolyspora flexuosa]
MVAGSTSPRYGVPLQCIGDTDIGTLLSPARGRYGPAPAVGSGVRRGRSRPERPVPCGGAVRPPSPVIGRPPGSASALAL